jgi:hypothetical protein
MEATRGASYPRHKLKISSWNMGCAASKLSNEVEAGGWSSTGVRWAVTGKTPGNDLRRRGVLLGADRDFTAGGAVLICCVYGNIANIIFWIPEVIMFVYYHSRYQDVISLEHIPIYHTRRLWISDLRLWIQIIGWILVSHPESKGSRYIFRALGAPTAE